MTVKCTHCDFVIIGDDKTVPVCADHSFEKWLAAYWTKRGFEKNPWK